MSIAKAPNECQLKLNNLVKFAVPVLTNLSKGELKKNIPIEYTWVVEIPGII